MLKAEVKENGGLKNIEIPLDTTETPEAVRDLFSDEKVITIHSEEATLEDIFIQLTGRELKG